MAEGTLWVDEWTPETAPQVVAARAAGRPVRHVAQPVLDRTDVPIAAVTGTAGKTTTTHLLVHALRHTGIPVVAHLEARAANAWPVREMATAAAPPGAWLVTELTSTHLCYLRLVDTPRVAVVTCLWPDHVELHGGLEPYAAAKRRILAHQPADGWGVLNADDVHGRALLGPAHARVAQFSATAPVPRGAWVADDRVWVRWDGRARALADARSLPAWTHPWNPLAALTAAMACGAPAEAALAAVAAHPGLPHRRRRLGRVGDNPVVDDTLAATPAKTAATLRAMGPGGVVLVAGGLDEGVHTSGVERDALRAACATAAAAAHTVVLFGSARTRLLAELTTTSVVDAGSFAEAVRAGLRALRPGDTLLVSPMFPMRQEDRLALETLVSPE